MLVGLFGRKYPFVVTTGAGLYMSPNKACSPVLMGTQPLPFRVWCTLVLRLNTLEFAGLYYRIQTVKMMPGF